MLEVTQYENQHTRRVTKLKHYTIAVLAGLVLVIIFFVSCSVPIEGGV